MDPDFIYKTYNEKKRFGNMVTDLYAATAFV